MNQQRLQQEPSMEEILASIRRIISEDEAASNKSRAPTGPTMPASANGTPGGGGAPTHRPETAAPVKGNVFTNNKATASPNGAHPNGKAPPVAVSGDARPVAGTDAPTYVAEDFTRRDYDPDYGEDTVLDLTEMVAEDGSVVTIAPVSPDGQGEGQGDGQDDDRNGVATYDNGGAYDDTLYSDPAAYSASYDEPDQAGATADDGYSEWNGGRDDQHGRSTQVLTDVQEDYDDYPEPEAAPGGHEPAPSTARVSNDGARETARVEVVQRDDPRTVPASRNAVRLNTALAALAGGDAAPGDEDVRDSGDVRDHEDDRDIQGAGDGGAPADAYDEMPEADPTGAYDDPQATAAATQGATAEYLESSALENMIRETMKPMLREWLDNNLTRLVEDVAREELHRMIESRGGL